MRNDRAVSNAAANAGATAPAKTPLAGKARAGNAGWRKHRAFPNAAFSQLAKAWLLDEGSLTAHLLAASGGDFRVEIISQNWGRPHLHEARLLGIDPHQACLLREVFLVCKGQPWVYARSVLPNTSLRGSLRHLRKFGSRPLGQLLFNDPNLAREPFELTTLPLQDIPGQAARNNSTESVAGTYDRMEHCVGRRSRFVLQGKPLMVSEIFLPAFWQAVGHAPRARAGRQRAAR